MESQRTGGMLQTLAQIRMSAIYSCHGHSSCKTSNSCKTLIGVHEIHGRM